LTISERKTHRGQLVHPPDEFFQIYLDRKPDSDDGTVLFKICIVPFRRMDVWSCSSPTLYFPVSPHTPDTSVPSDGPFPTASPHV
jgi:hypothetical protein